MHGPIGFQDYWLEVQGYAGKNLLKLIADSCLDKGIGITAITSDEDEIPRNSIHDRFNYLKNKFALTLPEGYEFDTLGKHVGIVVRNGEVLYILNGQTVRTDDRGRYVDYLVVGENKIRNHLDLEETMKAIYDKPTLIGGAEHGLCEDHHGIGEKRMRELMQYMSFVEGHNSQLIFPVPAFVPKFGQYRRTLNDGAQKIAKEYGKPWIATSDAHRIKDAGISYIEFDLDNLDFSDGYKFWTSLRKTIESGNFTNHLDYESFFGWTDWVSSYILGTKLGRDKKSERGMMQGKNWN